MRDLVFIDVEASYSKDISSVCCVSLILVDSKTLQEIEKITYFINSESIYDNYGSTARIDIGINPKDLKSAPPLTKRHRQLRKYLNSKYIVIGHAIENDIRMLNAATKKYRLDSFDCKFLCSQMLYRLFKKENTNKSLDKVAQEINETFVHHHCEEDVLMSFKTIKYICSSLNKNIEEIINEYQITLGENKKHKIKNTSSKLIKPSKHQLIQEIYKKKVKVKNKDPYFYNKIFVFDSKFERNNIELLEKYVVEIKERGGKCSELISEGNVFIDANPDYMCKRKKYIENNQQLEIEIVELAQLLDKL